MVTNIKSKKAIMNDYDKFGKLILEKVNSYIEGLDQIEFHKYLIDSFGDATRKPKLPRQTWEESEEESFYLDINGHFKEIKITLDNLDYIPVFIKKPFRKSKSYQSVGMTRESYLRYHVEHYFVENDICKNRMIRFLNKLSEKLLEQDRKEESEFILQIKKLFLKLMLGFRKTIGSNIHEKRLDKKELSRLGTFELLSTYSQNEDYELGTNFLYRKAKKEWYERIINNNIKLKEYINIIFGKLIPVVFPSQT